MEELKKVCHWYLHIDLDAFFASVEQLDNPDLRGKPVIVGGLPEDRRSVVSTASYEARKYGVHSAMPTFQAYKLCPDGIFVRGRMHRYAELSYQIMNIFRDYSPDVDQMSIDEAFIDLTGTEKLFGPPVETAAAIKKRVKEETGLTVSMGLASTKYLAKIASGLNKPDGFCHIKHGDEQNFMLNLPLNKVWGLGPKSLELIKSKGFRTTRDIYERDYDTLEFLFGKNMAVFLYDVVRGIEKQSFSRETKSHSISAETTFPYDLTDIYMIETELLELAHGVFFRLLKQEGYSRTAFVKIRYDDFSTSTVQETTDRNIITLDSFYEIIKRLFEKRYQNGRGIRLLGVGFENIVKEEKPYQQDLFGNNDEKKQAVEKAILKLSKKHPEIKVQKARTLKAVILLILLGTGALKAEAEDFSEFSPPAAPNTNSEFSQPAAPTEQKDSPSLREIEHETPASLFDYEIDDKNHVDFSAGGLWKSEFTTGFDFTFGNGTVPAASPQLPVLKQTVELTTLLTLNNRWYFQADFADQFSNNTFAFGYKSDNLIRHFRLANRGVTMSRGYSSEYFGYGLQGGNNQAPGASLLLKPQSEKWQADFLVRYDMTEVKSATYYGMNKAVDLVLSPADFLYGIEFRIPEGAKDVLAQIDSVYVECAGGKWSDSRGKSYRRLTTDEYAALISENRLYISKDAGGGKNARGEVPAVIVTFGAENCVGAVVAAAGSYSEPESFLGKLQTELGNGGKYDLKTFTGEFQTSIEGKPALILQEEGFFSPFLCPAIYSSEEYETEIFVQAGKSGKTITKYKAVTSQDFYTSLHEDFFNKKELYTKIINTDIQNSVYPFAEDSPEIYLGLKNTTGLEIHSRIYTPVKEILIPKTAAGGTVQVYKNGILLPEINFDSKTGVIKLNTTVSAADKILVTWQEDSSVFSDGALAIGAGYKINFLPGWNADIILTARQGFNQKNNYSYTETQKNSFAALSVGTNYENNGLKITEKANVALLDQTISKGLLLYSWDEIIKDFERTKIAALYPEKLEKQRPEKTAVIHFSPSDFSYYNVINIELDFSETISTSLTPLIFIFDEDSGTRQKGKEALRLTIKENQQLNDSINLKKTSVHKLQINLKTKTVIFDETQLSNEAFELYINKAVIPSRLTFETLSLTEQLFITKLSYEDAQLYGTFKNYLAAEYKKDGLINLSTESTQGTGDFSNPDFFINTNSNAELTLAHLKLGANLSSEKQSITEAGHNLQSDGNLFGFLSAEDTFHKNYYSKELRKQNSISLNFSDYRLPLQMRLKTNATSTPYLEKQSAEINFDFTQSVFSSQLSFGTKLSAAQSAQPENAQSGKKNSYAEDWLNISSLAFSTGKETASARNTQYTAYLSSVIPVSKEGYTLKPKITCELSDNYNVSSPQIIFSDKEQLKFSLPYTGNKKTFSFEIARTGSGTQTQSRGGTYFSDTEKLFALQNERVWFYAQLPFYELFDQSLREKLPQNTSYSTKYEANFRRTLYNSLKDLYIPAAVTFAIDREVKATLPSSDTYQIKAIITNNSINNFGSNSLNKTFKWFRQEELTTSLSAILKLSANDITNYQLKIQNYSQLLLYITEKSNITEILFLSFENTADWNLRNTISYTRPSPTSLVAELAYLIVPGLQTNKNNFQVSRKDSFTFETGNLEKNLYQKYEYEHRVSVDFMDYYNIFAGLGGALFLNQTKADRLSLSVTIGAKAEF